MPLPHNFITRLRDIIPANQFDAVLQTFAAPSMIGLRVNTLRSTPTEVITELEKLAIATQAIPWSCNAFCIRQDAKARLTESSLYQSGKVYLQNLSSQIPVLLLDPQPGEEILDLAAAPGSKTSQMACLMKNCGRIAAVEKSKNRYFKLKHNLEHQGVTCADTYLKDGRLVWKYCRERFDRVLLDAPCSSEARFDIHEPETFNYWNEQKINEMARNQWALLHSAWLCLKPGGILVYSTCSFAPEENEAPIAKLLKKYPEQAHLEEVTLPLDNIQSGLTLWRGKNYPDVLARCIRIIPNKEMSGFFVCRIKKSLNSYNQPK